MKKTIILFLLLSLLCGCGGQDITITNQNGTSIDVSASGKDTYTFQIPSGQKETLSQWENPFSDVSETDWFYKAVRYCHENNLISGTTKTTYSPQQKTSRAMIVSILWRLEGSPETGTLTFQDISADQYYADAVAWAASEGIVSGYSENIFSPNDAITREQLASILYRYAEHNGWDMTISTTLNTYADAHTISAYAEPAFAWAASHGIISGMEDHLLTPTDAATRAQLAAILMNLCENFAV